MSVKYFIKKCLLIIIGALCFGCAPSLDQLENENLLPEIDVVQVKEYSEEALKLAQESKMDVQMLNTKVTDLDNRIVVLSEEVASVSLAKIEDLENRLSLLIEAFKDLNEQILTMEVLPQVRLKKRDKSALFSPSDAAKLLTSSEYNIYQEALGTFDKRAYTKAREMFSEVLNKFPDGDYNDKAQYWIGECYYAQADYAKAIAAFNKVLKYKQTSKADDAQLKLGLSYLKTGENAMAVDEFKRLINRYPGSEYVPRAEKYLKEIRL